jgi:23S rRNA (cytosine1962-C5)-methyltransferase
VSRIELKALVLKPGREKSLLRRHPWVFSGAVERVEGEPQAGDAVLVRSSDGKSLATAAFSPESQIRARVWRWDEGPVDAAFIAARVAAAVARRAGIVDSDAMRLIHGEADGLPGVVADRYGEVVVLQLSSTGADVWRDALLAALVQQTGCASVYERSDLDVRAVEGLPPRTGALVGDAREATIVENGLRYRIDIVKGQKTGFYLDQRDNRARLRSLARGRRVLNCFCYTGGFSLAALAGGAESVLSIDSSAPALAIARAQLDVNGLPAERAQWCEGDVFQELRRLRDAAAVFDLIVLDPPKFAPTAGHVEKAARAYKDINMLALKLLAPGGLLATFSCSGGVSAELFQKIIAGAGADAGVQALVCGRFSAAGDHPVLLSFPEGEYLKGLLLEKL